jgi:hypothetical protein
VLTALSLALCLLVHPYTFFELAVPMGLLYVRNHDAMARSARLGVLGIGVFPIVVNAYWILPSLRALPYLLNSAFYHLASISTLGHDFLELAVNIDDTGLFMRTGLRFLVWGLGALGLWSFHRDGDDRFAPLAAAAQFMLAESYLGRYTHVTAQIQPYRFVVPATFVAALAATAFITDPRVHTALVEASVPVRALLSILAISVVQLLSHDALYYFPAELPAQLGTDLQPDEMLSSTGYPRHLDLRHHVARSDEPSARWFMDHAAAEGRILVEPPVLGERLAALVPGIQLLGGIRERNLTHAYANLFRNYPDRTAPVAVLARYLERYAVRWVVLESRKPLPAEYRKLLQVRAVLPEIIICEVTTKVSFFELGSGAVRAAMNRIDVNGSDPAEPVVLRYHWHDMLVCEPNCRLQREPEPEDAVGFMRVPAPHPRDFVIRNAY